MTNHPNRNWRKKWRVDPSTSSATHVSGLIVEFDQDDGGRWEGTSKNYKEIFAVFNQHTASRFARLLREAVDRYKEYLDKKSEYKGEIK